jgi:hypothetical protein
VETKPEKKRTGRPPEGSGKRGEPQRIRDYPTLLITIRPAIKAKLKTVAGRQARPAWQVVEDALVSYFEQSNTRKAHAGDRTLEKAKTEI